MDHILTRVARRVKDACDEWIERADDHEHGRRDKWGRKNQAWHEHEYERQRRSVKREARRKEKQAQAKRKKEKEGGAGEVVAAMMTGGRGSIAGGGPGSHRGAGSRDGSDTLVDDGGEHAPGAPKPEEAVGAPPVTEEATHEPGAVEEHEPRARGGPEPRDFSPMPSEHSASSIRARAQPQRAEERAKARAKADADRENPPLFKDSEDEEAESSDDNSSDEEDEAAKAAKKAKKPAAGAGEGEAPGIRGGGDDDEDGEEYSEYEEFDDEYAASAQGHSEPAHKNGGEDHDEDEDEDEEPHHKLKSRERRPYHRHMNSLEGEEGIAHQPWGKMPERSRQPHAGPRFREFAEVHVTETSGNPVPKIL